MAHQGLRSFIASYVRKKGSEHHGKATIAYNIHNMASQVKHGKSFEWAVAYAVSNKLGFAITDSKESRDASVTNLVFGKFLRNVGVIVLSYSFAQTT